MICLRSLACVAFAGCLFWSSLSAAAPAAPGTTPAAPALAHPSNTTPKRKTTPSRATPNRATPNRATKARAHAQSATPATKPAPAAEAAPAASDPAPDAPSVERASGAVEARVQPATEVPPKTAAVKTTETDQGVKTYTFGAEEVEGRLRSPQILYFLRRVRAEFDPEPLGHRSFLLELSDTRRNPALW